MSTVAFLPWFRTDSEHAVGSSSLLPYRRGLHPCGHGTEEQRLVDLVTESFLSGRQPIGAATIVRVGAGPVTRHLSDDERNEALQLTEMLATCGLAGRCFFGNDGSYCNREGLRVFVQEFQANPKGPMHLVARRRDGSGFHGFSKPLQMDKPAHVHAPAESRLDWSLLDALVKLRDDESSSDLWERVWDAIQGFNAANTDSDLVAKGHEVAQTHGAIERLMGVNSGKVEDLAPLFTNHMRPSQDSTPSPEMALRWRRPTVRECWIQDLTVARHAFGHGKTKVESRPFWTIDEHLLIGAAAFPLLLKRVLVESGHYTATRDDNLDVDALELRMLCKPFASSQDEDDDEPKTYPWQEVRMNLLWRDSERQTQAYLDGAAGGAPGSDSAK